MRNTSLLTIENVKRSLEKINKLFPTLNEDFYDLFCESLKENKVTDEELTDVVRYMRDDFRYKEARVSDFISYIKENRIPPEERKEEISEDRIIINPEKEREQEEFNARLLTRTDLGDTPEEEHEMFK